MSWELWLSNAVPVAGMMILLWLWSVVRRDVSVVDPWWSVGFMLVAWNSYHGQPSSQAKLLLLALVSVWAVRLWSYLLVRNWGKGEDSRYSALREKYGAERYWWFSLFQVFGLQGILILFISLPLQVCLVQPLPDPLTIWDKLGALLCVLGIGFETVADAQMFEFKQNRTSTDEVMSRGLWRYSRHPNYFGEAVLWWGFWLFSIDSGLGHLTILAPSLMTFLLLRVSGVTMLESQLSNTKPAYRDYIQKTSAFFPWPPKS